jgi:ribonuclease T2
MQFDQKTLIRIGGALLLLVIGALTAQFRDNAPVPAQVPSTGVDSAAIPAPDVATPSSTKVPVASGDFDYYLLVLSWSPTHCSGDAGHGRSSDLQCRSGRPFGFVLHGFWPQDERGYPENCSSSEPRRVGDDLLSSMMKISPSADLIQHEWQKHGTCSGLSQRDYFATAERAFRSISVPSTYVRPNGDVRTKPDDVREAFLSVNPALSRASIAATCSRNELAELWVCLDKGLAPRACSNDVRKRHCGAREVRMRAVRGDWPR